MDAQKAFHAPLGEQLMTAIRSHESCISSVTSNVLDKISDTVTNQGVMGVFHRPQFQLPTLFKLVVICDHVSDPGNVGTIIRTCYGFGVDAVITIGGCDVWVSHRNDVMFHRYIISIIYYL